MIIDFHTHIFPGKIAKGALEKLKWLKFKDPTGEKKEGILVARPVYTDGTAEGLHKAMLAGSVSGKKIDCSVILPVATKPSQFLNINQYAAWINREYGQKKEGRLLSFGGIHPGTADYKGELQMIKELGLPGIKLHPDFQETDITDERYLRILKRATELDLVILIHAGKSDELPDVIHGSPKDIAWAFEKTCDACGKAPKLVLAHLGGALMWDEVEKYLVGRKVYFDLSYLIGMIEEGQLFSIIKEHGTDWILFGSDSPWKDPYETLEWLEKLPFTEMEKKNIFGENALKLLKI